VSVSLLAWAWWAAPSKSGEKPSVVQGGARGAGQKDGGAVGLGEAAVAASTEDASTPSALEVLADDTLPEPEPGQRRPNSQGRCPHKEQVPLNGGCWVEAPFAPEVCEASGYIMFKDKCYVPALRPKRQPHSSPAPQQ
jgi:eukaryotic-like serine/threonine-protein kinase